ncbi:MAG: biopolymer transporter ExbB [Tateyamaria sp.]|nr:biopolymer transporter ExbB [Tateyamaria sp.]MDG1421020.1 biopolymer transporter ExbB [Tateyamaria sp.]MDG1677772.1 biopolymer transporter ExbB [Tateyamaria sp.]MDG2378849.1 biopolymer transporter ExbB [Tateyamaria sp.]
MAQPLVKAQPHFSQPVRQVTLMVIVLGLSGFGVVLALPRVLPVFEANPYLNGFIMFVFATGVIACFWMVFQLIQSVRWIERFAGDGPASSGKAPQLLASLASLLRSRGAEMQLNATSTRSILDSVATRIDEVREITRYIVNLLIFLGLLGTFYGLATTVPALVDTIRGLAPQDGEAGYEVFARLMSGLEEQLGGMGVAFASSLLGLAGSLVVGLLELFAGHGQNRFYRELEEWLSSITRVGFASDGENVTDQAAIASIVNHLTLQTENLQSMFSQSDVIRSNMDEKVGRLAGSIEQIIKQIKEQNRGVGVLHQMVDGQERLISLIEQRGAGDSIDAESRMRLRSIDVQMLQILEEIGVGRRVMTSELREDIAALTTALSRSLSQASNLANSDNIEIQNQNEGDI